MLCPFIFLAADPSVGRFDAHSLSDRQMLELLCKEMMDRPFHRQRLRREKFDWAGVSLNSDGAVTEVQWFAALLPPDVLHLEFIPKNVKNFTAANGAAKGTLDAAALPSGLEVLNLSINNFSGSVDFTVFPSNMKTISLQENEFYGSVSLGNLPKTLESLDISANAFSGSLQLDLRSAVILKSFRANLNGFSGEIFLDKLSESMERLNISSNKFSGEIVLDRLPAKLAILDVSCNALSGSLIMTDVRDAWLRTCGGSKNHLYAPFIDVRWNQLSGTAVLHKCFRDTKVAIARNAICAVVDEAGEPFVCTTDDDGFVIEYTKGGW